jgi:hypothetical protein
LGLMLWNIDGACPEVNHEPQPKKKLGGNEHRFGGVHEVPKSHHKGDDEVASRACGLKRGDPSGRRAMQL